MKVRFRASNRVNDYYSVLEHEDGKPYTVVHTEFDTLVCLTCRAQNCPHTKAVETSDAFKERE